MSWNIFKKEAFRKTGLLTFIALAAIIILIQYLYYVYLMQFITSWEQRSNFGEMFGGVNTLFSGLAFAGVLFTILVQQAELKSQQQEIKRAASLQENLVSVLALTAKLNARYSLLDSLNQKHNRSINEKKPAPLRQQEKEAIDEIEVDIKNSISSIDNMIQKIIPEYQGK